MGYLSTGIFQCSQNETIQIKQIKQLKHDGKMSTLK